MRRQPRAPGWRRCCRRRRWRPRSAGRAAARPSGTISPVRSCRTVRSPSRAWVGRSIASATPTAVDTLPSMPARPRLAYTVGRIGADRRQVEVADRRGRADEQRVGAGQRRPQRRGQDRTAEVGQPRPAAVELAAQLERRPAASGPASRRRRCRRAGPRRPTCGRRPPRVDPVRRTPEHHDQLDVGPGQQPVDRPGQRRMPERRRPARSPRPGWTPAAAGRCDSAAGPTRALLDGSASSGTSRRGGELGDLGRPRSGRSSPAMITVCGPAGSSTGAAGPAARGDDQVRPGRRPVERRSAPAAR